VRLPLSWLHEHCAPDLTPGELAERLDMTGTQVERVERHGVGELERFVVGRVLSAEPHPDADRLTVCAVDVGSGETATIVCGAPNVAAGQTVAVARPGAVMPDGTRLRAAKLRGVRSEGMILAEDELAIGADHEGILVLDGDGLEPGAPLEHVLPIADTVLELELTPNRPDCLGVYGVAREVHAATGAPLGPPPWERDPGSQGAVEGIEVRVEAPDLCPRFTARAFEDVTIGASPPWLRQRLTAAGQRPIVNVVDITNYAMLLAGQPLHAFDLDRVAGGRLVVRRARDGERVETLDGQTRELDSGMLVIDDADGPTSIAGVMGGARSEVGEGTTRVLLEAASWDGPNIHRTSTRLGLRSEASTRFEKGLAPEQAVEALTIATALMAELCGARIVPGTVDVGGPGPPPVTLRLRDARVAGLLGEAIPRERCAGALRALGFGVADAPDGLDVTVPPHRRNDVTREVDLIEEVARIDGLERLPSTLPSTRGGAGRLTRAQRLRRTASDALAARGCFEIAGWSFVEAGEAARLRIPGGDPRADAVVLENPMSEEQAVMRTTLLGSLLGAARRNLARGAEGPRLFEAGAVYLRDAESGTREPHHLAALLCGPARPPTWREPDPPPADVFAAKGLLAGLLDTLRVPWRVEAAAEPFLHPGRAARVALASGKPLGWLGELHPEVAGAWDLPGGAGFEIDLDAAIAAAPADAIFAEVTPFPEVRQDLAVVVADDVPAARVVAIAREAGGAELERAEVFDVYRGPQVGEGRVSLALGLAFRAPDRTLTDEEAGARRAAILAALSAELGAQARA